VPLDAPAGKRALTSHWAVKAARRQTLCFPLPPTPTSRTWPWDIRSTRRSRVRWSRASSNSTRVIGV